MLCESFSRWRVYNFGSAWQQIMAWLEQHAPTADPGAYTVGECTVSVVDTTTKTLDSCLFESHRRMVDVQLVIAGAEWLYTAGADGLGCIDPFDADKDIGYHVVPPVEMTRVTLTPGIFTLLFPWDAHMPLVAVDNTIADVRKAVAKIPMEKMPVDFKSKML